MNKLFQGNIQLKKSTSFRCAKNLILKELGGDMANVVLLWLTVIE